MLSETFPLFDSYYLAGVVEELPPMQTFFKDRYFPTNDSTDIFANDKVLIEYRDGDRRMAPFVAERAGDIPIGRRGYEAHEFEPPFIAPSRLLTLDDLKKRGFGESILTNVTPEQRALALQVEDLKDLDSCITRREEWMAAQTMIHNGCSATAYIDNKTSGQPWDVYYYDVTGSNPALYTVSSKWDATGGDFESDITAMCEDLLDRGLPAADLVVGSTVGHFLQNNEKIIKLLDNRRIDLGRLAPKIEYPGIVWLGRWNFGGSNLDIFIVRETYMDDTGKMQRVFPATSAMVTAPNCGHMMYGQITQMESDNQHHTFAQKRVPKFMVDINHDIRKLRVASRPLAAPRCKAPWMYAANVVGD